MVRVKFYLWPPSGNHTWQMGKGRMRLSDKTKNFRLAVKSWLVAQRQFGNIPKGPLEGDLDIRLVFFPPDKRRRDQDNLEKTFQDALTKAGFWRDDSQIRRKVVEWGEIVKGGAVLIEVAPYEEDVPVL